LCQLLTLHCCLFGAYSSFAQFFSNVWDIIIVCASLFQADAFAET